MSTLTSPTTEATVLESTPDEAAHEVAAEPVSEERMVFNGRLRRLHVIRHTIIVCAGLNVATVFGPWWHTELPAQRLFLNRGDLGRGRWIDLGETSATTSGIAGGELTRVLIVALAAGAIWWAMGKLWWYVAPAVLWAATPPISLAPPSAPPASRVGAHSLLVDLTTETIWLTANRAAFFALLFLTVSAGVQGFRVRRAAKSVEKSEGRPAGFWEKQVLPKLAEAGISLSIDPKNVRRPNGD